MSIDYCTNVQYLSRNTEYPPTPGSGCEIVGRGTMAKDAPGMRGYRSRNEDGQLRDTRNDKHVETLEKQYHRDFGVRGDMHVGSLLKKLGCDSVNDLMSSKKGR
jgi:hypothetical protein